MISWHRWMMIDSPTLRQLSLWHRLINQNLAESNHCWINDGSSSVFMNLKLRLWRNEAKHQLIIRFLSEKNWLHWIQAVNWEDDVVIINQLSDWWDEIETVNWTRSLSESIARCNELNRWMTGLYGSTWWFQVDWINFKAQFDETASPTLQFDGASRW